MTKQDELLNSTNISTGISRNDIQVSTPVGTDHDTHHLIELKHAPESLLKLREELVHHPDITEFAQQGTNFEDCLGRIGTRLDIALDGYYDVEALCGVLYIALYNRRNGISGASSDLVTVELHEKQDTVELVEVEKNEPKIIADSGGPKPAIIH